MMRLALDHITAVDAGPEDLASAAAEAGCAAMCLFMEPMAVLPHMPDFDLYGSLARRQSLRRHMERVGVALDLAYPFTLAGRTVIADLERGLACAAELGAGLVNALVYDRDPQRRVQNFGAFSDLAQQHGLRVVVEFYPVSQIRSLAEALELVQQINRPHQIGINADLMHLMRSGGSIAELAAAPEGSILYGQLCDGPTICSTDSFDEEASTARLLAGEGVFDLPGFAAALPAACPISVEIPRNAAIGSESRSERVARAVEGVRRTITRAG